MILTPQGKKRSPRHRLSGWLMLLGDLCALWLAYFLAANTLAPIEQNVIDNINDMVILPDSLATALRRELAVFLITVPLLLFVFYNKGHYQHGVPWWSQLQFVVKCCLLGLLTDGFLHYALELRFPIHFLIGQWVVACVLVLCFRQVTRLVAKAMGVWSIPAVMVGDGTNAVFTLFALASDRFPGYKVERILLRHDALQEFDRSGLPMAFRSIPIEDGNSTALSEFIAQNSSHFFIIALDNFQGKERDLVIDLLKTHHAEYAIVPPIKGVTLYGMEPHVFFGHDTLFLRPKDLIHSPLALMIKRLMDIIGALVGLTLSAPLFVAVWIAKRRDGTKMFYGHTRLGKRGKSFTCWKFQSMVHNAQEVLEKILAENPEARAEWERDFKLKYDPRVTRVGAFLRKTSLDEIPQLINVLKGDMSLVGPRPVTKVESLQYGSYLREYLSVRPGVTGLWQVSGRNDTTYEQRVYLDVWYVRNWSMWHDVVIIVKTIRALVFRDGAY
jgi:Undecaprenyl-phosphate galactose phosphotransferase WbaP